MKGTMYKAVMRVKKQDIMNFLGIPKGHELFRIENVGCDSNSVAWVEYETYYCWGEETTK